MREQEDRTLGARRPYTHEQVKVLYPVLSEVECRIVSHIENRFRWWEIYPDNENSSKPPEFP